MLTLKLVLQDASLTPYKLLEVTQTLTNSSQIISGNFFFQNLLIGNRLEPTLWRLWSRSKKIKEAITQTRPQLWPRYLRLHVLETRLSFHRCDLYSIYLPG